MSRRSLRAGLPTAAVISLSLGLLFASPASARRAAPPPQHDSVEGRGCSAFKPCPSGYHCVAFKQKCARNKPNKQPHVPPIKPPPLPIKPPPPAPKGPGAFCAKEGGRCTYLGRAKVFYGAKGRWASRVADNGIDCNNGVFGDPIRGVVKACYMQPMATPPPKPPVPVPLPNLAAKPKGKMCAVLFEHANFQGRKIKLPAGRFDIGLLQQSVGNDQVSSIRVRPGCRAVLFEHAGYQGGKLELTESTPFVGQPFNDKTSSVELSWTGPPKLAAACTVYEHDNFGGRAQNLAEGGHGMGTLNNGVGNDQVSSVRCLPGYEAILFEHAGFKGKQHIVRGAQGFVGPGFNDKASSIIVRRHK